MFELPIAKSETIDRRRKGRARQARNENKQSSVIKQHLVNGPDYQSKWLKTYIISWYAINNKEKENKSYTSNGEIKNLLRLFFLNDLLFLADLLLSTTFLKTVTEK